MAELQRQLGHEIESAVEQAITSFSGVTAAEIRERRPRGASDVWAIAAMIFKEQEAKAAQSAVSASTPPPSTAAEPPYITEEERNSRVPGEPRGVSNPAANRRLDGNETRLKELREALVEAKRTKRLANAIAIRGEILALERQLGRT